MAIPNVSQLTSRMATLPDQALQQYAAMHQDDPYVLSLAISEKNRRQALRQSAQAGPTGPMPTVAQQEIAAMGAQPAMPPQAPGGISALMPQGQPAPQQAPVAPQQPAPQPGAAGLSALPAPNMENMGQAGMAGGGVVGYAEGGALEGYQIPGMARDPRIADLVRARETTTAEEAERPLPALWRRIKEGYVANDERLQAEQRAKIQRMSGDSPIEPRRDAPVPAPAPKAAPAASPEAGVAALIKKASAPEAPTAGLSALPRARPAQEQAVEEAPQAAEPAMSEADLLSDYEKRARELGETRIKGLEELQGTERKDREAELAEFDASEAKRKPVGKEKEARIKEEMEGFSGKERAAMGNAAMRGILAVLAGTNPRKAVNIARGAAVALNSFDRQQGQIEARRDKLNASLDSIQEMRDQAQQASGKERQALKRDLRIGERDAKREMFGLQQSLGYEGSMKVLDTGLTLALKQRDDLKKQAREDAVMDKEQAFKSRENALDRNNTLSAAGIRASTANAESPAQSRMALVELGKQAQAVLENPLAAEQHVKAAQVLSQVQEKLATLGGIELSSGSGAGLTGNPLVDKYLSK